MYRVRCGKIRVTFIAILFLIAGLSFPRLNEKYEQWRQDNCGIPDAVSSVSSGGECDLTVVANSSKIEDREEFAREVVWMCTENTFRTVRFSTDLEGWPVSLDISVYLKRGDVGEKEPVFHIRFEPPDRENKYDIRHHTDMYRLFVDAKEISLKGVSGSQDP